MNVPPLDPGLWLLALAPVAVLFAMVVSGRVKTTQAATAVVCLTVVVAAVAFRAGPSVLLVGVGKGLWLGTWILCVVWPALLLYRLASGAGLERIGGLFAAVSPNRRETLLLVSWLFPAFIQGVAGFGTPIALAAPLLLALGWDKRRAVVYPLIGYHWSVTFGSMGSSFYMASLTAGFGSADQDALALRAAALLGVNCLVAGALVLLLDGGWQGLREGKRLLLGAGLPMAGTLVLTASVVPAVATLAAGAVGFAAVFAIMALSRRTARRMAPATVTSGVREPDGAPNGDAPAAYGASRLLAPYAYLLATALPVFLWPLSREWVTGNLRLVPRFPGTETGYGWANAAVDDFNPIFLVGHPGFYLLLACLLGYLTYRRSGLIGSGRTGEMLGGWVRSLPAASAPILLFACVATVLVDAGMVSVLARGVAQVTGAQFWVLSPVVGALGSFMTGSTTSANALFAALQRDIAELTAVAPAVLVAAQTAGANVGNALAPVVILVGLSAVDDPGGLAPVLRACLLPGAILLGVVILLTGLAQA